MTDKMLCHDPKPHKEHSYRRIGQGRVLCPGHNNPEPPREPWYDCEHGTADLCPKHAAADALLAALEELMHLSEVDGPLPPGLGPNEYRAWRTAAIAKARAAIAKAKETA